MEEVLNLAVSADYEVLLNAEIKNHDHELVDETIKMLKHFSLADKSLIACINAEIIGYIQDTYPEMRTQGFPKRHMRQGTDENYLNYGAIV